MVAMISRRTFLASSTAALAAVPLRGFAAQPLTVVATTGMIADTARRIGGAEIAVTGLLGSGVDPHSYRQTRQDIAKLTRADLVLWHGLYLEAQMEEVLLRLGERQSVVAVTDHLEAAAETSPTRLIASEEYAGRFDPHIWMDPGIWSDVAERIAQVLTEARPSGADAFANNLAMFKAELSDLQAYGKDAIGNIPQASRVLVTAHDAFAYFGRAFGMEVVAVQGVSTESEAGLHRIGQLVDMLVTRKIEAVFVESSVSDRNIRALIEGAAAQGHAVRLGGELFSDAMGAEGTYAGTLIGMLDHNITTIATALGGPVPERGHNGRLSAGG